MNNIYYEKPKHPQKKNEDKKKTSSLEDQYFQPSYQAQDYTASETTVPKDRGIKDLIANVIMIVLSIGLVINLCLAIGVIGDMNYSWAKDEDSFWYSINDGNYAQLIGNTWTNRFSDIRETDGLEQCYAVAEYFEAASLYKAADYTGDMEKKEKYAKIMEEKLAYFDDIMYIAEDINMKLGIE